jgi:hypothetical protein
MSSTFSGYRRPAQDHFHPEENLDHHAQRKLRGQLEQIDYTAFASNQAVVSAHLSSLDPKAFQRLAIAAAEARVRWVCFGVEIAKGPQPADVEQIKRLETLRLAWEELNAAYEGLRRLIERGYLHAAPAA